MYVLAHHTVSIDTRVALTVVDVCLTVGASKAQNTCACISIDNILWNSFQIREQVSLALFPGYSQILSCSCEEKLQDKICEWPAPLLHQLCMPFIQMLAENMSSRSKSLSLVLTVQLAPFLQGVDKHSSWSVSQLTPKKPAGQAHLYPLTMPCI